MRIYFILGNKDETSFNWDDKSKQLAIYFTNPFKLGIGFKYLSIDKRNVRFGDYINPYTGMIDDTVAWNKCSLTSFRFTLRHWRKLIFLSYSKIDFKREIK